MRRDWEMEKLRGEAAIAKVLARRLWDTLTRRVGGPREVLDELFARDATLEARALVDQPFDAALTVWERHRVFVEPCRVVLDPGGSASFWSGWPTQGELYLAYWPDGSTRNLTRDQLMMMAGFDTSPARPPVAVVDEVPF